MFANRVLSNTAWGYYRSAGDDEYTLRANAASFKRWWFRPRVLNKISATDLTTIMLGHPLGLPIYISPSALARLGHPDGEMNLTRAAGKAGIIQGVSLLWRFVHVRASDLTKSMSSFPTTLRVASKRSYLSKGLIKLSSSSST